MIDIADALTYFAVFLLSTTLHEAAHAWTAMRGGDLTAYNGGQASLDPIPHIRREPFGMVVLPLVSALLTGWPFGYASAPYNVEWARRYPDRAALMALAGPAANLLLVILAALVLRGGEWAGVFLAPETVKFGSLAASNAGATWEAIGRFTSAVFSLNLLLCVFNLLPFPPLDGSAAITLLMNRRTTERYQEFVWSTPMLGWMGLFVAWQLFEYVFDPVFTAAVSLIYPGVTYG
jgi:Zn-dependent protease